jgi:hypothetical protein
MQINLPFGAHSQRLAFSPHGRTTRGSGSIRTARNGCKGHSDQPARRLTGARNNSQNNWRPLERQPVFPDRPPEAAPKAALFKSDCMYKMIFHADGVTLRNSCGRRRVSGASPNQQAFRFLREANYIISGRFQGPSSVCRALPRYDNGTAANHVVRPRIAHDYITRLPGFQDTRH